MVLKTNNFQWEWRGLNISVIREKKVRVMMFLNLVVNAICAQSRCIRESL